MSGHETTKNLKTLRSKFSFQYRSRGIFREILPFSLTGASGLLLKMWFEVLGLRVYMYFRKNLVRLVHFPCRFH